jgi:4-alpha-glucanotransferase
MKFSRSSGILLHPTSLPGPFGIGDLGEEAYRFADFLVAAGQNLWQVLPLGHTGSGASPYSCTSSFAGNTLLISPEKLAAAGLLTKTDLMMPPRFPVEQVDFEHVRQYKNMLLRKAFERFRKYGDEALRSSFEQFCATQAFWLNDYALFQGLKESRWYSWDTWEASLRARDPATLRSEEEIMGSEVTAQKFYQFLFFTQWRELKHYCNERGIKLIGDMPIFVAHDSADVWTHPELFKLDQNGMPTVVAGVPPDYFSATGQFWGNPLYDWDTMATTGFSWWIERLRAMFEMFDLLRIDHFRGFVACWEIPAGDRTAEGGQWVKAPGRELFAAVKQALGELPIIAEDLGVITPDVDELREAQGFPGMRVMQFGFSSDRDNLHLPHNYLPETVAYTATHDNNTTVGWLSELMSDKLQFVDPEAAQRAKQEREFCLNYLKSDGAEVNWDFINAIMESAANTAIVPLQDVLGLGTEARMNLPNTVEGNWEWRFREGDLNETHAVRLRELVQEYGRGS